MFLTMLFSALVVAALVVGLFIYKKKMHYWLWGEIKRGLWLRFSAPKPARKPIHVMFGFMDHFEPGNRGADEARQRARVDAWVERYPRLASKHRDADGCYPKHTFFFPPHYDTDRHLEKITQLCAEGYGEVEMHLHHDRQEPWPDDEVTLRKKIVDCIDSFSRYGVFCLPNGERKYAFIHGDWALANSLKDGSHCGVNDELSILASTGCYADFTFPVSNEAQPSIPNTIFYATSDPHLPKGYNKTAVPVEVNKTPAPGLILVQGILGLRWKSRTHAYKPSIEQSNIGKSDYPFAERTDYWINKHIHIKGKEDWIFVKLHTHGAREIDWDVLLGEIADHMYAYLETKYNDGENYVLHYVSAREMYNIIKAAEAGKTGNPNDYRDFEIPPFVYLKNTNSSRAAQSQYR
jgi:hypothetical protein